MLKKFMSITLVLVILLSSLVGCSGGSKKTNAGGNNETISDEVSAKDSVIIAMGKETEPEAGLDPIYGWGSGWHPHNPLIQSSLLTISKDTTIGKDLATDYSVSEDGLVWTFKIREGVKFTDGEDLDSSDVVFTFNKIRETVSELDFSMVEKVEAIDKHTVEVTLNKVYAPFAYVVANVGIVPEHAYDSATYGHNPIGSGPFIFKQWDKGEQIILEENPDYYGDKSTIKKITVVFMTNEAAYAAAQGGQLDVLQTDPSYTVSPVDGYKLLNFDSIDHRDMNMPMLKSGSKVKTTDGEKEVEGGNDVTSNLALRQAVSYAIDREAIVDKAFHGYAKPSYSNGTGLPWDNEKNVVKHDPEKAKSIMEADGWKKNSDGIYEKDGLLAEFTILCMDEEGRIAIVSALKEMLDEFGIKINIKGGMSWSEVDPLTYTTPAIIGGGQYSPIGEVGRYYSGRNRSLYSNPAVDKHIDDGFASSSLEEAYENFKLSAWDGNTGYATDADCPWIYLITVDHLYFVKEGLNIPTDFVFPHEYGWAICNEVSQWTWK